MRGNTLGDPAEIAEAVAAIWAAPACDAAHRRFLKAVSGIVNRLSYDVSLLPDDFDDARTILQQRLLELAMPPGCRRVSELTGRVIVCYDPARCKSAYSFFYGAAKSKSLDILKARKIVWKHKKVMFDALEAGEIRLVHTPPDIADAIDNRRVGVTAETAERAARTLHVPGTL